jgi:glycosyltransferase involved in cell wall biosynthesis
LPQVVIMVTTSYPRFPGDSVGTFMEPIAKTVAARGHEVHIVAPWHPLVTRGPIEDDVQFHFYKYAPLRSLNVFGYAAAMNADVSLKGAAFLSAPLALAAGWRAARKVAQRHHATIMHGHWVIPGGVTAAAAAPNLPLVISLHGSDVYVAERLRPAGLAARAAFRRAGFVTACSADLASRAVALGADNSRIAVVPYGVDPDSISTGQRGVRAGPTRAPTCRRRSPGGRCGTAGSKERLRVPDRRLRPGAPRRAGPRRRWNPGTRASRRAASAGLGDRIRFLGDRSQDEVAALFAAADLIATPSVRDDSGNVDGLPNAVMEALASGTALVTTTAGGIGSVVEHERTAFVVPERDASRLAAAINRGAAGA